MDVCVCVCVCVSMIWKPQEVVIDPEYEVTTLKNTAEGTRGASSPSVRLRAPPL